MRFCLGPIPNSSDFVPDDSWKPLREPSPWLLQLIAIPLGLGAAVGVAWLWIVLVPLPRFAVESSWPIFLLSIVGIIAAHELIHMIAHPMFGRSPHSIVGLWPSKLLFYAHYDGELTRNRLVVIFLLPLIVISFVPLAVAAVAQWGSVAAALVSIVNALAACGDVLGTILVLLQIPATGIVRNQGWKTYWRDGAG
jgi:hypothetical protein